MTSNHNNPRLELCPAFLHGRCNNPCPRNKEHRTREQIDNHVNGPYRDCNDFINTSFCIPIRDCTDCLNQRKTLILSIRTLNTNFKSIEEQIEAYTNTVKSAKNNLENSRHNSDVQITYSNALSTMNDFIAQRVIIKQNLHHSKIAFKNLPSCNHHICPKIGLCNQCKFGECSKKNVCFYSHNINKRRQQLIDNENNALTQKYILCNHFRLFGNCKKTDCKYLHNDLCELFRIGEYCNGRCGLKHYMTDTNCDEVTCRICYPNICNMFRRGMSCDNAMCRYTHYKVLQPTSPQQIVSFVEKETKIIINQEQNKQLIAEYGTDIDENGNEVALLYTIFNVTYQFCSKLPQLQQRTRKVKTNYIDDIEDIEEDYENVPRNFRHSIANQYIIPEVAPLVISRPVQIGPRNIHPKVLRKNKFKELNSESYWLEDVIPTIQEEDVIPTIQEEDVIPTIQEEDVIPTIQEEAVI